jgi:two-component system, OmpR family, sensor kinase
VEWGIYLGMTMLNKNSLFFRLRLFFIIGTVALITTYFVLLKLDDVVGSKKQMQQAFPIFRDAFDFLRSDESLFSHRDIELIDDFSVMKQVVKDGSLFRLIQDKDIEFRVFDFNSRHYFLMQNAQKDLFFTLKNFDFDSGLRPYIHLLFLFLLVGFYSYYYFFKKSILPLKSLAEDIKRFGEGDFSVDTRSQSKDEIAVVGNEFTQAIGKIKRLRRARTLFLRNMMHELKTPITKGKLVTALMDDSEDREILENVFDRMERIVMEMSHIEQLVSEHHNVEKSSYLIKDIISNAITLLFMEDSQVVHDRLENETIIGDKHLLEIVFKNLIDNAIKYSDNHEVNIYLDGDEIVFSSIGLKIKKDLLEMIEPFSQGVDDGHGLGLGLYIVHEIIQLHHMELKYEYSNGCNNFIIAV